MYNVKHVKQLKNMKKIMKWKELQKLQLDEVIHNIIVFVYLKTNDEILDEMNYLIDNVRLSEIFFFLIIKLFYWNYYNFSRNIIYIYILYTYMRPKYSCAQKTPFFSFLISLYFIVKLTFFKTFEIKNILEFY
jgi:hypothetical protein